MTRLINLRPGRGAAVALGAVPLGVLVAIYAVASSLRHAANPNDKILPTFGKMGAAINMMAFQRDEMTGKFLLWIDTAASLQRLGIALAVSTLIAMALGLILGVIPLLRAQFGALVATISVLPPIAVLPILFILFGLGETSKIVLIIVGVTPFLVRDLTAHVAALPVEQMIKGQTLGAGTWLVAIRVALPQMMPRLIDGVRLSLGPAWVFLISAEAIVQKVREIN